MVSGVLPSQPTERPLTCSLSQGPWLSAPLRRRLPRSAPCRFLEALLSRVRSSPHINDLCDVVHAHAVGPFSVYVDYVRNQQYQEETYSRLM